MAEARDAVEIDCTAFALPPQRAACEIGKLLQRWDDLFKTALGQRPNTCTRDQTPAHFARWVRMLRNLMVTV